MGEVPDLCRGSTILQQIAAKASTKTELPVSAGMHGLHAACRPQISTADWFTEFCSMFGIPEILSTDGGQEFMSSAMQKVLQDYGVHHRVSTAHNPHSNC